jgi:hypothetical protein
MPPDIKRIFFYERVDRPDGQRPFWSPIRRLLGQFGSNVLIAAWAVRKMWCRRIG